MSLIEYDPQLQKYVNMDLIIKDRAEALAVIAELVKRIENNGFATVSYLDALIGMNGHFADQFFGWTSLRTAEVREVTDGFLLDLPAPEPVIIRTP